MWQFIKTFIVFIGIYYLVKMVFRTPHKNKNFNDRNISPSPKNNWQNDNKTMNDEYADYEEIK